MTVSCQRIASQDWEDEEALLKLSSVLKAEFGWPGATESPA